MFTGLVAEVGRVRAIQHGAGGARLGIQCSFAGLFLGESIAVNGCCLTVTSILGDGFTCDASRETLDKSTTGALQVSDGVHLERALQLGDRLGGHLVTGHVDGVGRLVARAPLGDAERVTFSVPRELAPFVAPKGSITIDGASLTVNHVDDLCFDVVLVPYTLKETLFGRMPPGGDVNLEVDVLAKYVARLLGRAGVDGAFGGGAGDGGGRLSLEMLARAGFVRD